MCGFVGVFNSKPAGIVEKHSLEKMRDTLEHRGPDGAGIWYADDQRCALAHRRLSIIDLSETAAQPMYSDDQKISLVFNGEIYNHAELRQELIEAGVTDWKTDHSDTEVILKAYSVWGIDCVHKFYGMFAIAIYDRRDANNPVLHLFRDRVGVKPLYFSKQDNGEWIFGSEIKAILAHPHVKREMEPVAFWHYLTFIVAPAPLTMFKGIFKIPAGYHVEIDCHGNAKSNQYWDCAPDKNDMLDLTDEEATEELTSLLKTSIKRRMVSDVPFGVLLSGGVDSSMNVALMSELMDRPVKTFTIGYEGQEETNEYKFANRIAKQYKTDHHETIINDKDAQDFLPLLVELQDEPIADNVCIPLYFLSKLVKDSGTTVVQVGEGADENFLGYWWCDHYLNKHNNVYNPIRAKQNVPLWRKLLTHGKASIPGLSGEDLEIQKRAQNGQQLFWGGAVCWWGDMRSNLTSNVNAYQSSVKCPVDGLLPESFTELNSHNIVDHYQRPLDGRTVAEDVLQKIPYMELKLRLSEHLLMRVDKMTMAHSIEARVPFLDHDVVDFARRLHPKHKLHDGIGKSVLKKAAEPYLDNDMIYRKKQGFGAPMEAWFKEKEFGQRVMASYQRSRIKKDGFINNEYFESLLKHQMGSGGGYSFHLWTMMNAMLWYESWIDGNKDCF